MILFKLAFRNVKKSFRDYSIYFLTLMAGVCIFYVFNSIESQQAMMAINSSHKDALKSLNNVMAYVSVFISVILGFLILYANGFLIKRRKKELGIYQILGMEKGQISKILLIETILVGLISLIVGLLLGVLISQGMAVVTASLFEVKLTGFVFVFSLAATLKTILYFGLTFLLVVIFNAFTIGRQKLINLIYADRRNEKFKMPHLVLSVILFIISLVCIGIGYAMILKNGLLMIGMPFLVAFLFGCFGTFLFFFSLSGFFLKVIQQNKKIYLKNLNMFVLRQLNSKINTTYMSMTMVCLLLFFAICSLSAGMGISHAITEKMTAINPYDATYTLFLMGDDDKPIPIDIISAYEKSGVDFDGFSKDIAEIRYYNSDIEMKFNNGFDKKYILNIFAVKVSDYNKMLKLQGKAPIVLKDNEFVINCNMDQAVSAHNDYQANNKTVLFGKELKYKGVLFNTLENSYNPDDTGTLIVPDQLLAGKTAMKNLLAIQYIEPTIEYEKKCRAVLDKVDFGAFGIEENKYGSGSYVQTKIEIFTQNKGMSTTIAYLGVYLGIVFLITSATVLAIIQLSESSDNARRYGLLRKIGAEHTMINKALLSQIAVYFTVPLLLAIVHSIVGIIVVGDVVEVFGHFNILKESFIVALMILLIYGGYFVATYWGSKNIINKK